jgi:hypothetical protein
MHAFRRGQDPRSRTHLTARTRSNSATLPPPEPLVFNKLQHTVVPTGAVVGIPDDAEGAPDDEAELAVAIRVPTAWRPRAGRRRAPHRRLHDLRQRPDDARRAKGGEGKRMAVASGG